MIHPEKVVVVGNKAALPGKAVINEIRGPLWGSPDLRYLIIVILSVLFHGGLALYLHSIEIKEKETARVEELPDRFATLIIDKPIPEKEKSIKEKGKSEKTEPDVNEDEKPEMGKSVREEKVVDRAAAKKAVAARAAKIEKKIRTVGVLGMLTGSGTTAKGPAVVDVLGSSKERNQDLDNALDNVTGLKKAKDISITDRKLVRSKDVAVDHKEEIDNLLADLGTAQTSSLAKKGNFMVRRPESIEGAASSSAKRSDAAIKKVVNRHKTSIRMSYEKYLKRDPDLSGKITVRFTISSSGRVASVQILENTTGNRQFENEIVRKVKMWRFDSVDEGDAAVTYPFVFQPS